MQHSPVHEQMECGASSIDLFHEVEDNDIRINLLWCALLMTIFESFLKVLSAQEQILLDGYIVKIS